MQKLSAIALSVAMCAPVCSSFADSVACESRPQSRESLLFTCPLPASDESQRLRFAANFSGGHDDTMAQLVAGMDSRHMTCESGSKVSLASEEGDVSLYCIFTVAPGAAHTFSLDLSWSHAEYVSYSLEPL